MSSVVFVELTRHGVVCEANLNDIPLMRLGHENGTHGALSAHEYLVPGGNVLELIVEPGATPTRVREEHQRAVSDGAWAVARIVRYPVGVVAEPGNGEVLTELQWRLKGGVAQKFPQSSTATVTFNSPFGAWRWQSAPRLTPGKELLTEAHAVLASTVLAIRQRNLSALMEISKVRIEDAMRAYPALTTPYIQEGLREFMAEMSPEGEQDPTRFEPRLVAGGRMLQCVNSDCSASVQLKDLNTGEVLPYDLFLGRDAGRMCIMR